MTMGNYQTSNNQFWVTGDGNDFSAEGGLDSTNAASLDFKAGKTNPGGHMYVISGDNTSDVVKWDSLTPLYGIDGQMVVVLTAVAMSTFEKMVNLIEMYRPLLEASQQMACYRDWKKDIVLLDGYVGSTPQSAVTNFVTGASVINLRELRSLGKMYQNILGVIANYDRDIQVALSLIPHSTPIGSLSADMHSILRMFSLSLKPTNVCYLYPEAALQVIRAISPTVRNVDTQQGGSIVETLNLFEPVFNGTGPNQPPLTDQSEVRAIARSDASLAQLSLISSTEPIEARALKSGTPTKTYDIRLVDPLTTPWVSKASALAEKTARIQFTDSGRKTWYTAVGKGTLALHLDDITSMSITMDLGGESYYYKTLANNAAETVDPESATVAFILFSVTRPLEEITTASELQTGKIVAFEKLMVANSSVQGAKIIANTSLKYNFDHNSISGDKSELNHYLLCQLLFNNLSASTTYTQQDAWAGKTTMQSLDSDKVTVKGVEVDRVIPAGAFGNYTTAEQKSSLPNDLHSVMATHLERAAKAMTAIDDEDQEGGSTIANAIFGALISKESPVAGPIPWKNIKFDELRVLSDKAASSFKRDPSQALISHDPVLGDSAVMTSLLGGIGNAVKTKGLSAACKDTKSALTAAQSGRSVRQTILDKIEKLFPPGPRPAKKMIEEGPSKKEARRLGDSRRGQK
uniref:Mu1 n=3 Tax=Piscine orthoreovirus TaxID=1157337 RepID=A0A7T0Q9E6_9REOV|nr:mu1 [Piscine orthoreovirus]QPL20181.1 mu1 [Piscine orthoreovirus]QPL20192.1 mu1 [Piscine orthoreovirus]QPL20203.1 mu1 [Piscine orthoreovirus]QPL20280.1 mu1 [Piscine orthoreovirus]